MSAPSGGKDIFEARAGLLVVALLGLHGCVFANDPNCDRPRSAGDPGKPSIDCREKSFP